MTETRVEYAVRYDAPAEYAGIVARMTRSLAERVARRAEEHALGDYRCTVVRRTVTYGEWEPAG